MNQKYIDMVYSDVHLDHHGVLGQKWGVENRPPYPLGRDVQSELSNGASYHSLKKAIKSDYKAEKKELKNTVINEEKHYMNTLNDERRKHEESQDNFKKETQRNLDDYQHNRKMRDRPIDAQLSRDIWKEKNKDIQSRISDEETRYDRALEDAKKRNDDAWNKYSDSMKAAKENYKNEKAELKEAKKANEDPAKERLNTALKIAGVAAGVAAVAGVSYLAAKEVSKKLDKNDGINGLYGANKFNRANIAEKIAKDKTSAKGWHEGMQEAYGAQRRINDNEYSRGLKLLTYDSSNNGDRIQKEIRELNKSTVDNMMKKGSSRNKAIENMTELGNSKSIRDKAATKLLDKYEKNADRKMQKHSKDREQLLEAARKAVKK